MPFGKVIVAISNKHARQIWAMLARDVDYDPHACLNDPMHQQTLPVHAASRKVSIHRQREKVDNS